jgi:hypothetical protein
MRLSRCVHSIDFNPTGGCPMDMLAHCKAMRAFCRQRTAFEGENYVFWAGEAEEWDKLISEYANPQPKIRTGRVAQRRSANDSEGTQLSEP